MPSSHPFPSIAALALSLYASDKRVEKLPTVTEYAPTSRVEIVKTFDAPEFGLSVVMFRAGDSL